MKRYFLLGMLVLGTLFSQGQSLSDLRAKKEKTQQQIKYTNQLLNEARNNEKRSLSKLKLLNEEIDLRNQLINSYTHEIENLNGSIGETVKTIESLTRDLDNLKVEYTRMIRFAQKNRSSFDKVMFVLSSEDLNQAYKRMIYLQQYSNYRRKQGLMLQQMRDSLNLKVNSLENQKRQQLVLISNKKVEADKLDRQKSEQRVIVESLQKQQSDLQRKLREQQKMQEQLNQEIERVIAEEARKSSGRSGSNYVMTPEQKLTSDQLEKNKGRLPWPVERGIITEHFGIHSHAVLKSVQVKNNGIDISTSQGATARAVFNGEVSKVFAISGGNMAVIVRHGNYLTVYSNLKDVQVKAGDKVKTKQSLGTVFTDAEDEDKTVVKFQIWKESTKLNPEDWLSN